MTEKTTIQDDAGKLLEAAQRLFSAPIPKGKHTTTGGVVFVSLRAMAELKAVMEEVEDRRRA